ncbi:MAG TPA: translation initiation factor IF-6 [Candidatus Hodarchaeales archaeon]|nr:translation initiation factor IF-6 [Candidatus Hodarchaeales archaeon]
MSLELVSIQGGPNIGLWMIATDNYAFLPDGLTGSFYKIAERVLHVPLIEITTDSRILGALVCANDNGVVVSHIISDSSLQNFREKFPNLRIERVEAGYFAMGNIMITNNRKTLVSPIIGKTEQKSIADALDTETLVTRVAESDLIGSLIRITERGGVISPIAQDEDEINDLSKILFSAPGKLETSTVNRGFQFPAGGIIANSKGALLGNLSTGIEIIKISEALFPDS